MHRRRHLARAGMFASVLAAAACVSAPARPREATMSAVFDAPLVAVRPGESPRAEFARQGVRTARVSGRLVAADGRRLLSGTVVMRPAAGRAGAPPANATLLPDGQFSFDNVPPGHYDIRARGATDRGGDPLFASFALTIDGRDIEHLRLTLTPGGAIDGSIRFESSHASKPPALRTIRIRAPLAGTRDVDVTAAPVSADGSFALRGLRPGAHEIVVDGLASPWLLARAEYHGRDVADRPFELESGDRLHDIQVVVSDRAAAIDVRVTNEHGDPAAAGITVLLFPADPQYWSSDRRLRAGRTDAHGLCRFDRLPEGPYLAIAGRSLQASALDMPGRLEALHGHATRAVVTSSATTRLQLTMVPDAPISGRSTTARSSADRIMCRGRCS